VSENLWVKITHILIDGVTKGEPHDTSNCFHKNTVFKDELPTTTEKIPQSPPPHFSRNLNLIPLKMSLESEQSIIEQSTIRLFYLKMCLEKFNLYINTRQPQVYNSRFFNREKHLIGSQLKIKHKKRFSSCYRKKKPR
jgi:hypothetical protein